MSDFLKHECGIAAIRLLKPLSYFQEKYGSALWGFNKLFLLMEKQHNRGHDGAGIGCSKLNMPLGEPYIFRRRNSERDALARIFSAEMDSLNRLTGMGFVDPEDSESLKQNFEFGGEILMGHLRYGTSGIFDNGSCHPYLRRSNWTTRTLMVMGNFNMANAGEVNEILINRGQHPVFGTDTQTVLEEIGFHLDEAHTDLYRSLRDQGVPGRDIPSRISQQLNVSQIIRESASAWDGGYAIVGAIGNGDMFVLRDSRGIRPCHILKNEDFIAIASERVALMTAFEVEAEEVEELGAGHVLVVKNDGQISDTQVIHSEEKTPCSFERIYFSRGNDPAIYLERKAMGVALVPQIVKAIDNNFEQSVFSFIPNTAETAYHGMMEGLRLFRRHQVRDALLAALANNTLDSELVDELILRNWPRGEKIAHKDIKLRTFISEEKSRMKMVSSVYDITYGVVNKGDTLVVIDDSIVRGTTLRESILKILGRTRPKKIVVASTAPQIRYPDCYGIDMSEMGRFIAFQAAISLLRKSSCESVLSDVYKACLAELNKPKDETCLNPVKQIYDTFSVEEISEEISRLVTPIGLECEVETLFQSEENLHASIEGPCGDWYFSGKYPTPGGFRVVNRSYVHWFEGHNGRAYTERASAISCC